MERRGKKSVAQTPAPKKDRIYGSERNPKGSASSSKSASKIELSESIINTLENKRDEYNAKHPNGKVTLATLKAVFRRGAGAYSSSHRPTITGGRPNSRSAWAFARVNKFLLKKGGTKVKAAYVQDDDLMEKGGIFNSSCKTYISQNEDVLKTGYYLNLSEFSSMIDPYGQIPLNIDYTLVTYNSGNQDGLSLIDTINPINLQNELAEILNISINNAQVVVGLYIEMGKKLKLISQIESDNIIIIDRDKVVCKSDSDKLYHLGGDMSKHLAPNGKPSNLTHEQWHLVRTPEFKSWFGDWENDPKNASKVVDENGEPLVVYHGTESGGFHEFKPNYHYGYIYFAKNKEYSIKNFKYTKGNLYECFLNIRNIVDASILGCGENYSESQLKNFYKNYNIQYLNGGLVDKKNEKIPFFVSIKASGKNFYGEKVYESISNQLKSNKYNGLSFYETSYMTNKYDKDILCSDKAESTLVYVIFEPNQIKLADGSNTTFDANNPDIRYEDGGLVLSEEYSGKDVKKYLGNANYKDDSFFQYIKDTDKYILENVDIDSFVMRDSSLFDFIKHTKDTLSSNENEWEWHNKLPIVIGDNDYDKNIVLDGYHRITQAIVNNENEIVAFVKKKKYADGGLVNALKGGMENINKNGIVLSDNRGDITVITYNTGNQEVSPSLYNKSLIYKSVQPIKSANEIMQNFDLQDFERFKESKIADYKKSHLIVLNQNEVVYDSNVYAEGGDLGQEITCVNCGWHWNTNQSDEFDKYVCHKCGFDNRTFYDSDPIGKYHLGGDMSKHLAPNGKPSNLNHEQWHLVRTSEFKAWFGDWENDPENSSKVVDENGEPLVVYHGGRIFNEFKKGEGVDKGIYFTNNKYFAQDVFAKQVEVFERDKKNYYYDDVPNDMLESDKWEEEYFKYSKIYKVFLYILNPIVIESIDAKAIPNLYNEKNDGVIVESTGDFGYWGNQIIVFEPNQIKLADGTNTTFDANNPDIRYKNGGNIENEFDDLDNNQLVKTLKSFYSDLSESPIFKYLDLKDGDYTLNIGDNELVVFKKKPFSKIEAIKIGRFIQPYFDASKKPLFSRFFDSYTISGKNIIIKVKDMYKNGGQLTDSQTEALKFLNNSNTYAWSVNIGGATTHSLQIGIPTKGGKTQNIKGQVFKSLLENKFIEGIDKKSLGITDRIAIYKISEKGQEQLSEYKDGGLLKKAPSVLKIADKHNVDLETVDNALKNGIKVEMEHTKNKNVAKTIALHHLYESPKYYEKLKEMEKELNLDEHYEDIKKIYNIGGVVDPVLSFSTPTGEPSKLTYLQQVLVRTNAFKKFFGDWEYAGNQFVKNGRQEYEYLYRNVSKVIDKITLEPKVVYHGTRVDSEFFVFDVSQQSGLGRPYGYFAHNIEYSQNFTSPQLGITNGQPFLYKCFVNIRNPFYAMTSEYYDIQEDAQYWKNEISKTIALDKYTNELDANKLKTIKDVVESQIGKYIDDTFRSSEASFWVLMARDNKKLFKYFLNNYRYDGVFYAEEFSNNYDVDNPAEFTEAVTIFEPSQVKLADGRNLNFDPMNVDIRYEKGGDTDNVENTQEKYNVMGKRENLRNLLLGDKYAEGGEVVANKLKDGNDGKKGGYFEGRSHAEGGIKAYNKDTGQMIEVEGEEVIITKGAVKDEQKREFEGEMLTNREILSRINQSGGGVSFEKGGEMGGSSCGCSGKKYKYGGEMMDDYSIVRIMNRPFEIINDNFADARAFADMLVNKLK